MHEPLFFHHHLEAEFEAAQRITEDLAGPEGEQALTTLLTSLRLARDKRTELRLRTGDVPWVSRPLTTSTTAIVHGRQLHAEAGDILEVHADWRLEPHPAALRDRRLRWACKAVNTSVTVKRAFATVETVTVPLFSTGLTASATLAVPATIPCVVEAIAALVSPAEFDRAVQRDEDSLSLWHEIHKDRAVRLAAWQADKARKSRAPGREAHSWVPPGNLFVREEPVATRPRGRSA
ncbi:MAG: hypothetical protein OSA99_05150 [Acidimicrobiales bacterium]|nr:hypothetical protein [Acidimicrobiales bacterium]